MFKLVVMTFFCVVLPGGKYGAAFVEIGDIFRFQTLDRRGWRLFLPDWNCALMEGEFTVLSRILNFSFLEGIEIVLKLRLLTFSWS